MKKAIYSITLAMIFGFTATATEPKVDDKKEVDVDKSSVIWKGYKVTGSHTGTVRLTSGVLEFDDDKLIGGEFMVDMTTLISTDLEGDSKGKLETHLKSDDFFGVEKYPTAKIVFTEVTATGKNSYQVIGNLTVKDITKPVTFDVSVYGSKATATLKVDRTEHNVRYGSNSFFDDLKDKAIYDEFDLVVDLEF